MARDSESSRSIFASSLVDFGVVFAKVLWEVVMAGVSGCSHA